MSRGLKRTAMACAMVALSACASTGGYPMPPPPPPPPPSPIASSGAVYRLIPVRSDTASQFYFVKSDIFFAAGPNEAKRREAMASRTSFGPFNLPTELSLMEGAAYDLLPRCGDAISWKDLARVVIASTTTIKLDCR